MCHPLFRWPGARMRHGEGNGLKDQAFGKRLRVSPLNRVECEKIVSTISTLQRHFSRLTKFARANLRLCSRNRKAKVVYDVPINPGSTKHVCRSVVVGVR